jgi:hypothetical protein
MNWTGQALHVARKDVRYTRWTLIVYSLVVLAALLHALMLPLATGPSVSATSNPLSATMFVLVLLGIVLAAVAVQADPPVQSNAFWASRPFAPGAMLGGKLLYCGVVILGVPLVAELIGLLQFNVTPGALVASLVKSAVFYGLILLCTVVVAGLTSDLRGFIVASLALVVGFLITVAVVFDSPSAALDNPSKLAWIAIAVGVGVALLAALYRRRGIGRIAWIGAVIVVGATSVAFQAMDRPAATEVPASLRASAITLDVDDPVRLLARAPSRDGKARIAVRFNVANIPSTARLAIQVDSAFLHLRDGSIVGAGAFYGYATVQNGLGALPPRIRPFASAGDSVGVATSLTFNADSAQIVATGTKSVEVWAHVDVAEVVPLAVTRVGTATAATVRGTRLRVFDNLDGDANAITVLAATVADPRRSYSARDIGMAVINESSREGIVLSASNYANSNDWMVLPGAPINISSIRFNPTAPQADRGPSIIQSIRGVGPISDQIAARRRGDFPGASWYENAKIVVVQWIPRGSYPLRLSKTLN